MASNLTFYKKGARLSNFYQDLESDPVELKFAKNGVLIEKSITIPKADVAGKVWFPHILVRNASFVVNFGGTESSQTLLDGFTMVEQVLPGETRVRGPARAESKADCEVSVLDLSILIIVFKN